MRAFYEGKIQISPLLITVIQVHRGLLWALVGLMLMASLRPGLWTRALAFGAAVSGFMVMQLAYPGTFMPTEVRWAHFVEISVSNFVFGVLAGLVLVPIIRGRTE